MGKTFVSYAHEDSAAAHQIAAALTKAGLELWLDARELRTGDVLVRTIAEAVVEEAEYFAIVLTRRALTKPWVLTEMRMALTSEIEKGRPRVLVLRLDDCEVPVELRHKKYLDFRGRFDAALTELADHIKDIARAVPTPKQTILAEMILNADGELWARLCAGCSSQDEWKDEVVDVIRDLRSDELEAAISIGSSWSGQQDKWWESWLIDTIRRATPTSNTGARRIMKRLAADGFLDEARDLDYSKQPEGAWCEGDLLLILSRAARRSGLFSALPPPMPERLSSLLVYDRPIQIQGAGEWYAVRFAEPIPTALEASETAVVAVARQTAPARTWAFRSPDDFAPLKLERYLVPTELTPADPFAAMPRGADLELLGFDLATFDDLGVLQG